MAQVRFVLAHQSDNLRQVGSFGFPEFVGNIKRRDVDAVEHVADVVQDTGGHFGHSSLTGGFQKLFVDLSSLASACLRAVMSRPIPTRPTMLPC